MRVVVWCLLLAGFFFCAIPASAMCVGETPDVILDCLVRAYEQHDPEALASLFSPDCVFFTYCDGQTSSGNAAGEIAAARDLFENPSYSGLAICFDGGSWVCLDAANGIWRFENASMTTTIVAYDPTFTQPHRIIIEKPRVDITVQFIRDPMPHWVITKWESYHQALGITI